MKIVKSDTHRIPQVFCFWIRWWWIWICAGTSIVFNGSESIEVPLLYTMIRDAPRKSDDTIKHMHAFLNTFVCNPFYRFLISSIPVFWNRMVVRYLAITRSRCNASRIWFFEKQNSFFGSGYGMGMHFCMYLAMVTPAFGFFRGVIFSSVPIPQCESKQRPEYHQQYHNGICMWRPHSKVRFVSFLMHAVNTNSAWCFLCF